MNRRSVPESMEDVFVAEAHRVTEKALKRRAAFVGPDLPASEDAYSCIVFEVRLPCSVTPLESRGVSSHDRLSH